MHLVVVRFLSTAKTASRMFGVKHARTCPPKPFLEPHMYDNAFGKKEVHHRMCNEKLGKVTRFGDPRSINKCAAHKKQ